MSSPNQITQGIVISFRPYKTKAVGKLQRRKDRDRQGNKSWSASDKMDMYDTRKAYENFVREATTTHKKRFPKDIIETAMMAVKCARKWEEITTSQRKAFYDMGRHSNGRKRDAATDEDDLPTDIPPPSTTKPKRPRARKTFFLLHKNMELKQEHPDWNAQRRKEEMNEQWIQLPADERRKYDELARRDKEKYERELLSYMETTKSTKPTKKREKGMRDLPNEIVERILQYTDGVTMGQCRLVHHQWHTLIEQDRNGRMPKVIYRSMTAKAGKNLEISMEKFVDEAVMNTDDKPTDGAEDGVRRMKKQARDGMERRQSGTRLKIKHTMYEKECYSLMQYLKHVHTDQLIIQCFTAKGLTTILRVFARRCLQAKAITLDFCNFKEVESKDLFDFFKPRKGKLQELVLASCREMGAGYTPEEFWNKLGGIRGQFPTIRIRDHYIQSPWINALATFIMELEDYPWMIDFDGIEPAKEAIYQQVASWYGAKNARNRIIKLDNCRGIRLPGTFNAIQRLGLRPGNVIDLKSVSKILERCFDGKRRYSTTRSRLTVERPDGIRMAIHIQK